MKLWQEKEEKQLVTTAALIYDDRGERVKVFLVRRAQNRKFLPGMYELPGGHVRYGEHVTQGLARLIRERLHVEIDVEEPIAVRDFLNSKQNQHVVQIIYLAHLRDCKPREIMLEKKKYAESLWVDLASVESRLAEMKERSREEYEAVVAGLARVEKRKNSRK